MKKIIILLIASIFVLFGCSSAESESDGTLTVWAMGAEGEQLQVMADKYEEQYGTTVEVVAIPWDQAHDKLLTAVASQEGPDVVQLGTTWIPEFAEAGALADVSGYAEEYPETFAPETYFAASQESMYYNDVMVSVPWYVDTRVLYYRTDMLAEVGYEEAPATWEELYDASTKLVEQGVTEYGMSIDKNDQFYILWYAWSYGWTFFNEDGTPNFDDPIIQDAINYYNKFFAEGLAPLEDDVDILQSFSTDRIPMFVSGPWMVSIIQANYPELEGKWDVALLPAGTSQTSMIGGSNWCIWEWSDNKDEAAQWIDFMNQPENQITWFETVNVLPSNMEAWADPVIADDQYMAVFGEQLESATAAPAIPEFETIATIAKDEADKVYYGEQDAATAAASINEQAIEELE